MKCGVGPFDLLEDVTGFGGQDERLGMFIMTVDVLVDSVMSSSTLRKAARRSRFSVKSRKKRSTRSSLCGQAEAHNR
jgi:hypothetical protein